MRVPFTVNINTVFAYQSTNNISSDRKVKSEDFLWDSNTPEALASLCIKRIALTWAGNFV